VRISADLSQVSLTSPGPVWPAILDRAMLWGDGGSPPGIKGVPQVLASGFSLFLFPGLSLCPLF
jgi:hypothetical protein